MRHYRFVGVITGFLLLDERDDRTLTALMVTPMPLTGYLAYRLSTPLILSTVMAMITYPVVGLLPLPLMTLLPIALLSGFAAPILAVVLASLAENKVAGMALQKMLGSLLFLPVVAYFLPEPWQWLAGIFPTYWPMKVFWLAASGQPYLLPLITGLIINVVYLMLFTKLLDCLCQSKRDPHDHEKGDHAGQTDTTMISEQGTTSFAAKPYPPLVVNQ